MLVLEYEVDDDQAQRYFDYAGYHVRHMTPMFRDIAYLVQDYVTLQFDSEGVLMSGGWAELAPRTVQERGSEHPILEREGILRHDATAHPARGSEYGGGLRYGNGWLTFMPESYRNGVDLVEVHSEGRPPQGINDDGEPYGAMPPRPIWETPATWDLTVQTIALNWLNEVKRANIRRAGRDADFPEVLTPSFSFDGPEF